MDSKHERLVAELLALGLPVDVYHHGCTDHAEPASTPAPPDRLIVALQAAGGRCRDRQDLADERQDWDGWARWGRARLRIMWALDRQRYYLSER